MNIFRNISGTNTFIWLLPLLFIYGCGNKANSSKEETQIICEKPLYKDLGNLKEYPTAAGFTMRIPKEVGALGDPNKNCLNTRGELRWRWYNGQLQPDKDREGNIKPGSLVRYFIRFSHPPENRLEQYIRPEWQFEHSFRIPSHKSIVVLPYAGYGDRKFIPQDRSNKKLWKPLLLLEDALDPIGNALSFDCPTGLNYEEVDGRIQISLKDHPASIACMAGVAFADGAGGRLDIFEKDFLNHGAAITNATMNEVQSYIVKE